MRAREEAILERHVLARVGADPGLAIFKNEVGSGYYGAAGKALVDAVRPFGADAVRAVQAVLNRHHFRYGLHVGSADLIGVAAIRIEPAHVGRVLGRFVSWELKSESGRMRPEQHTWEARMAELGALAVEVRSPDDAVMAVERARRGQ